MLYLPLPLLLSVSLRQAKSAFRFGASEQIQNSICSASLVEKVKAVTTTKGLLLALSHSASASSSSKLRTRNSDQAEEIEKGNGTHFQGAPTEAPALALALVSGERRLRDEQQDKPIHQCS